MNLQTFFEKFDLIAEAPGAIPCLREIVLQLAVQGRLSESNPDDERVPSVEIMHGAVASLANALGLRSPKELEGTLNMPFDIPQRWRWVRLAELGVAQTGTTPNKNDVDAFGGEVPFIKPADIFPDKVLYTNEKLTRQGAVNGSRLAPPNSLLMV